MKKELASMTWQCIAHFIIGLYSEIVKILTSEYTSLGNSTQTFINLSILNLHMKLKVQFFPASLWKRAFAYIIDVFVINLVIIMPFQKVLEELGQGFADKSFFETYKVLMQSELQAIIPKLFFIFTLISLLSVLYWAILEYKIGQSVGKILFNIHVKSQTEKMTFWQCFLRNVTKVSTFPLILDASYMIFTRGYQRYFEKISRTFVVEPRLTI